MNPFTIGSIIQALTITAASTVVTALPANCAYGVFDTSFTIATFNNSSGSVA